MLNKISCVCFREKEMRFHAGLNVILGGDDGRNSIGKSSALMVIDFAMGGDSLLEDKAGAIKNLGHHSYEIEFLFDGRSHFFKRSTDYAGFVQVCDPQYVAQEVIPVESYRERLKGFYGMDSLGGSFRSIVGPFSRIWNKGGIEPSQPFLADAKEKNSLGIARLIDLFERVDEISAEKALLDSFNQRKSLIGKSMAEGLIPRINKTQYKQNERKIIENSLVVEKLKRGFDGALSAYEALFDESLRALHQKKIELTARKSEILAKIDRLDRDLLGVAPRLSANIALVAEFFPEVNVERLKQVEAFHANLGKIVQKELRSERNLASREVADLDVEIGVVEEQVRVALDAKGTPDDLFARVFELKEVTDRAVSENGFYDLRLAAEADAIALDAVGGRSSVPVAKTLCAVL